MVFTRRNLDWWCQRGILSLVIGMLVFAPLAFGAVDSWAFLVVEALAMGVLGLWAARLWLEHKPRLLLPPLCWVVLAFMIYAIVRYFTSGIEYVARQEVIQVLLFGFLFFALLNNLRGQEEISAVVVAILITGTFCAGYAVVQLLRHSNQVWNQVSPYLDRASGTYISPNNLACLLAMLLPLALAYLLVGKVKILTRILLGYAAIDMAAGLAVTFSRGGYIAAGLGVTLLLCILFGHSNHRWKAVLLLAVLLAGGGFLVSRYLSKTAGYAQRMESAPVRGELAVKASSDSRLIMWAAAVQMWRDNPWGGVGPGHFDCRFREYRPETMQARPDRVHNDYLNLLADWGAIGAGIVLIGLGVFFFSLWQIWPHVRRDENDFGSGQSNRFAFFLGSMCSLAALAAHSVVDFNLHIPANALLGVTLLALLASNARYATKRYWWRVRQPAALGLMASIPLLAVVGLVAQEYRGWGETIWLRRAATTELFSPARAHALEKAFAYEPKNSETAYNIGECYRTQSLEGGKDYRALGQKALGWYAYSTRLNPYDGYSYLRTGMCMDWLGDTNKSFLFYSQAELHDPNGYFMVANIGWHYVQTGDYAAAREWFERSLKLWGENPIARNYLSICDMKLADQANRRDSLPTTFFR